MNDHKIEDMGVKKCN